MKVKAIRASIYKNGSYVGCANGGISERYDDVYVVCDDGNYEFDVDNLPENLVKIVTRHLFGKEYKHAEPYASTDKGCVGWMAGGSIVYTSDSRFGAGPLCLHDRQETQEMYNRYFD